MSHDRLTHEQRKTLRSRIDQARREAQSPSNHRAATALQQKTADKIEALLASKSGQLVSLTQISRELNCNLERVKRALDLLQRQQRATPVEVGRYTRWKAATADD